MTDFPFTDADGRAWRVMDYCSQFDPSQPTVRIEKRVAIGSSKAEARAFVPEPFGGNRSDVMVYRFGWPLGRDPELLSLQQQLDEAFPATATQLERQAKKPLVDRSAWRTEILKSQWRERGWPWPTFAPIPRPSDVTSV